MTGARIGEVLALRVKDVDLLRREIRIERTWDKNTRVFGTPKTHGSIRRVDLLPSLAEVLVDFFSLTGASDPDGLLFPSPKDSERPLDYVSVLGVFQKALEAVGLPHVTPHSLRHSWTSTMLSAGAPIATIARNLGHSSPAITWRVYCHEVKEGLGDALHQADSLFRAAGQPNVVSLAERR